ncbi:MAG: deoxyguanosinetriphosphate triphosphohydrolase [Firmicutes bacterium]|nr:deoxyguanosinetriphosphate triphosphohydrolase [Bacillota bacterium]
MQDWPAWEDRFLAPWAAHSRSCRGRALPEPEDALRTPWQHDRDRIIHCKAFRRLKHKTQVFINPKGDHFRTRLSHTLEVSQISRTVGRALGLNEDLIEAIALGHDLGHTPFGHAGERALNAVMPGGFAHNRQSLRVVDCLEREGRGLNLTEEVRDGILCHTGEQLPATAEGAVVRLCDRVAYLNHDVDDAIRSGYLHYHQLPQELRERLGNSHSERIDRMVGDIVATSEGRERPAMSEAGAATLAELRSFMFEHVYFHPEKVAEEKKLQAMIREMFARLTSDPSLLPPEHRYQPVELAACDYIAGMTDNFALEYYDNHIRRA